MLKITEQAQEAIASIVADGGGGGGLRISGTQSDGETALDFDVAEAAAPGDETVTDGGAVLFLDETAAAVLGDKVLDVHAHGDHFHFSIDEQSA
jgi:Fe-S cluster assembly iron-binding protein IscA